MFNPVAIRTYCEIVFADPPVGSFIALRGFSEKGRNGPPHLVWIDRSDANWTQGVVDFVAQCDQRGLAAYCIPGFVSTPGGASAEHVTRLSTLVLDFDSGDINAKCTMATSLLGTASMAVWSGGRIDGQPKTHLYWRLRGDMSPAGVGQVRAHAAARLGADPSFGRITQPVRIAGSVHRKGEPTVVGIAYTSDSHLDVRDTEALLSRTNGVTTPNAQHNGGPPLESSNGSTSNNALGLSRQITMDELPKRRIGHGDPNITRFEAITRMAGMMIGLLHDLDDDRHVEREFGYFRDWALTHIENVERDYDLRGHWNGLMRRERWKRTQPRRPRARPAYMPRG